MPRDPDDPYVRTLAGGRVTAPIVGGNLFTFVHLLGTPWDPVFDGAILMFEEVNEPPYVIEVHLHQLQPRGQARPAGGRRRGRAVRMRLAQGTARGAAHPFDRRRAGAVPGPARGPDALQAPPRSRETSGQHPLGVQATLDADAQTLTIDQPGVVATS